MHGVDVGDGRADSTVTMADALSHEFSRIGYDLHARVLDAVDYGVPQKRKRAIIVCVPKGQQFRFPGNSSKEQATVGDAIGDLPVPTLPNRPP